MPAPIALIGMSGAGKSYWSERLRKDQVISVQVNSDRVDSDKVDSQSTLRVLDCDALIAAALATDLKQKNIESVFDVAKWLGYPFDSDYVEREKEYLRFEEEVLEKALDQIDADPATTWIIDTTGSAVYLPQQLLSRLRSTARIFLLDSDTSMQSELVLRYQRAPKPIIWNGSYSEIFGISKQESLVASFVKLMQQRRELYRTLAHTIIAPAAHHSRSVSSSAFWKLLNES